MRKSQNQDLTADTMPKHREDGIQSRTHSWPKHTPIMSTSTNNPTSKTLIFFIANYNTFPISRVFQQLSSSSCWRVMAFSKKFRGL